MASTMRRNTKITLVKLTVLAILAGIFLQSAQGQWFFEQEDSIFTYKDGNGGTSVHLPSLLVTRNGTLIAACQLRKDSQWDWGHETDILVRRSTDGGKSWLPVQTVYSRAGINAVNGPIVEDRISGEIILPLTVPPVEKTSQAKWVVYHVRSGGNLQYIRSRDEGRTWSSLKETKPISTMGEIAWPSNSSHGIQLSSGRLVIGAFIARVKPESESYLECEYAAGLMYSDDHGASWHIGAKVPYNGTDEITLIETADGGIYVNFRINNRRPADHVRGYARSSDGGESFDELGLQDNMSVVNCHVGLARYATTRENGRNIMLYSGPYGGGKIKDQFHDRTRLTIRASLDEGRTWPSPWTKKSFVSMVWTPSKRINLK